MKRIIAIVVFAAPLPAIAQVHWVGPYVRKDGTFVQGHLQSNPDSNPYNNLKPPRTYTPPPVYVPPPAPRTYSPPSPYQPYKPYTPPCYYNCK